MEVCVKERRYEKMIRKIKKNKFKNRSNSGADPGFPIGGGANIWFCQILRKTAWNWENFGPKFSQFHADLGRPRKSATEIKNECRQMSRGWTNRLKCFISFILVFRLLFGLFCIIPCISDRNLTDPRQSRDTFPTLESTSCTEQLILFWFKWLLRDPDLFCMLTDSQSIITFDLFSPLLDCYIILANSLQSLFKPVPILFILFTPNACLILVAWLVWQ